ncbi:hypothetical protein A9P82_05630 [Arachidicoccus ginsenosidimutans]|uniref:hypothetical protein n=1 Tax=Arachidicoccus sp. BS20 TaxID=1850526 RepID=UPI0007F064DF|nr:hypothetical protein [Arachidicoccus sp. BS20]ANI88814.1 hypothetical protein A9P82_05630 [Arachidicoccus sp. BS20]
MKKIFLWCIPAMLLLASCSTSRLTTSWVSPKATETGKHFNKVLVLGLLSNRNRAVKVNMENALAQDLATIGVKAETATDVFGPVAFRGLTEKQVLHRLHSHDIDGVITIALIDKNSGHRYVPGYWGPYYSFWGYYSFYSPYMWGAPYAGYYERTSSYSFETNLYDLQNNNKLIYSAQSETVDPSSPEKLGYDFGKTIVNDLKMKNLLR